LAPAIERLLNSDLKDEKNANGWTYIEQLAKDLFERPEEAAKLTATSRLPQASRRRLNAPTSSTPGSSHCSGQPNGAKSGAALFEAQARPHIPPGPAEQAPSA
jgi:hypothetical protein